MIGLGFTLVLWLVTAAAEVDPPDSPTTFERVWYRPVGARWTHRTGDLTIGATALEFAAESKNPVTIPFERIRVVSLGKLKGDVDTDWVVLGLGGDETVERVGFRDGRKMGYGGRTGELLERLRAVLRRAAAAQFRELPAMRLFEEMDDRLTVAVPEDWTSYLESVVLVGGRMLSGAVLFSAEPVRRRTGGDAEASSEVDEAALALALAGEVPGMFVERREAGRGADCRGLGKKVRQAVLDRMRDDPLFGRGGEAQGEPSIAELPVDGCSALRFTVEGRRRDGVAVVLEVVALAPMDALILFGLRATAERFESFRAPFDRAIHTIRLSAAR